MPPGDFADFYISSLRATSVTVLEDEALELRNSMVLMPQWLSVIGDG